MEIKKLVKGKAQYIDGNNLYVSQGRNIFIFNIKKGSYNKIASFPCSFIDRIKASNKYGQRLFRSAIHHILKVDKSTLLVIAFREIKIFNLKEKKWICSSKLIGKRPLVIGQSPNLICYGEYHTNNKKNPMKIIASNDLGVSWFSIYAFKNIRHIHGISWDRFINKFWITTGDNNQESAIWLVSEDFSDMKIVVGGSQQSRAVQLLIQKNTVFYATDTPLEQNYFYKINKELSMVTLLNEITSSVFYGTQINNKLFFSTVCEPSEINEIQSVKLYHYNETTNKWYEELSLKKDFLSMKYFQYGQISFPAGDNLTKKLYFSPMSCKYDGWVMEGDLNE